MGCLKEESLRLISQCLSMGARVLAGGAKIVVGELDPGCKLCIEGKWSCIGLNQACTRKCFFCPMEQPGGAAPVKEKLMQTVIPSSSDYVALIGKLGIKGVGISGGEPLATPRRLVEYVAAIRREFGSSVRVWVYTNGDLADDARLKALADAGVDEVRFDLSARQYDLTPVRAALRHVRDVVIETPAIPEEIETLKRMLPELRSIGVRRMNLHQLIKTPFNAPGLDARGYSYAGTSDGGFLPVIESEHAALELLLHVLKSRLDISVNYCSWKYKHRFHGTLWRRRVAHFFLNAEAERFPFETATPAGLLRRIIIRQDVRSLAKRFAAEPVSTGLFALDADGRALAIQARLLCSPLLGSRTVGVEYYRYDKLRRDNFMEGEIRRAAITPNLYLSLAKIGPIGRRFLRDANEKAAFLREFGGDPGVQARTYDSAFERRFAGLEFPARPLP